MNKKLLLGIIALAAIVVGAFLLFKTPPSPSKEGASGQPYRVSLRLAWLPGATFAGDYVAQAKGYWKAEGIDVTINAGGFEYDAVKLVAAGADTFGITSGPQLLLARANGVPVVAIGATIPRSPIGWVAKKASGIKAPQDFIGKKVGAQFGTHTEITFEALFAKLGIDLTRIQRIAVKFDPRPFVVGEIDVLPVYIIDQPVDLRQAGLDLNVIDPGDYGVSLAFGNLYFTSEQTLKSKPDLVRRFLRAATKGWLEAKADPKAAAQILSAQAPDTKQHLIEEKLRVTLDFIGKTEPTYRGVFRMSEAAWEDTRGILAKHGGLQQAIDIKLAFTNGFLPE